MIKHFFSLFIIVFLLVGCTNKPESTCVIKYATWGSASEIQILTPIIKQYEKNNPNIKIELIHIPQDYFQKIHLLFASNLTPDVIFINNLNIKRYIDYLEPINIDNKLYYSNVIDSMSSNGNLYAIPRDVSNLVIFYNKDLFNLYNINYPTENWTLDDLLNNAKYLTKNGIFGISYEENFNYAIPYMLTMDESLYPYNNIKSSKGVKFYKNLAYKYNVAPKKSDIGSKTVAQLFLEEKIAMHLSGRWLVPKYKESAKFNWGVVTFPGTVACDTSGWAISKQSKHKKQAFNFIKYLSSKENIQKITNSGLIVPARIDVPFKDKIFINAIKKSKKIDYPINYNKLRDKLNDEIFVNNS